MEPTSARALTAVVREAEPADLPALLELYTQLADDRVSSLPARQADAETLLASVMAQNGRSLLVATVTGAVAATADVLVVPNLTHGGRPWAIVENVVVDVAHQRSGVGRALMEEVRRRCETAGCYKIQLLSRKARRDAHRFYERLGFSPTAEGFRLYLG